MANPQELAVREKRELAGKDEKTVPGRFYVPLTDVFETNDGLTLVMEMPGVDRNAIDIALKDDVLRVEGRIDFGKYRDLAPVYTEYNIGHYARSFSVPDKVDQNNINAQLEDGVLTLTLPKTQAAQARKITLK
jgi:HSP20 family molecular chaperone IbpA